MGEIKQANFRVDEEKAAAFRSYCEQQGINQATGFERMLEALELQQAKQAIPARETEISEFERCLRHLQGAYLNSLELNEQAEARIRDEFARQLDTKDRTIADYQDQIAALKEEKKILAGDAEQVKQLQAELEAAREQAQKDRMAVADRDLTIKQLTANNEILQIKAEGYDAVLVQRDSLTQQVRDANQEIKDLKKDHTVELERAARAAEKAQEAAVSAAKAAAAEELAAAREVAESRIQGLQADLQAAKEMAAKRIQEAEAKAAAIIADLREQLKAAEIASAKALQEAEKAAHEADRQAAAELREAEKQIADLREKLAIAGRK